jgi:hypothetical protein
VPKIGSHLQIRMFRLLPGLLATQIFAKGACGVCVPVLLDGSDGTRTRDLRCDPLAGLCVGAERVRAPLNRGPSERRSTSAEAAVDARAAGEPEDGE